MEHPVTQPQWHPIQRRYHAEQLVGLRRFDHELRAMTSQRRGRIDPNPHQIDAVMFALERLSEGGCILADEVGLGKTIEAGLVIAQRLAEGVERVLLIVPKALVGQWQDELSELFGIASWEARSALAAGELSAPGVYLAGREWAGSEAGSVALEQAGALGLCVIDEAHELFAGLHKRYDKYGQYREDADEAQTAHRVRQLLQHRTPVLLLTATPIQNSLLELWGLVQYVEPTGTLLGNIATFKQVFCDKRDARLLHPEQAMELKQRLAQVVKRTLRRDAQKFLERPFVPRSARLYEYRMSEEELELYNDVTAYLLEPTLCAFPTASRKLLLIGFHRRMASSVKALAASLRRVAARLEAALELARDAEHAASGEVGSAPSASSSAPSASGSAPSASSSAPSASSALLAALSGAASGDEDDADLDGALDDVREAELAGERPDAAEQDWVPRADQIEAELKRVRGFCERAEGLPKDSKVDELLKALRALNALQEQGQSSGKLVIFTESLTTQRYLRDVLVEHGGLSSEAITLFSGTNDSPRAKQALAVWQQEIGDKYPQGKKVERSVAERQALVHEFRTKSRVFISTEAGAKGLNLQFCEVVVNFDLPWNPQRIEQRIGRCHRYGQERHVLVVSFIARQNEAERLLFDILCRKLDLFGEVLDASDQVLHERGAGSPERLTSALGLGLEQSLMRIYETARSTSEMTEAVRGLDQALDVRKDEVEREYARAAGLIERELHEDVQRHFRRLQDELPARLQELDSALLDTLSAYLTARSVSFSLNQRFVDIAPSAALPEGYQRGARLRLGGARRGEVAEPLHSAHPLIRAALEEAEQACRQRYPRGATSGDVGRLAQDPCAEAGPPVRIALRDDVALPGLKAGQRGRLVVEKIRYPSAEPAERLLAVAVCEDGSFALDEQAQRLLQLPMWDAEPHACAPDELGELIEEAIAESLFEDDGGVEGAAERRFQQTLTQLERFIGDRTLVARQHRADLEKRLQAAEHGLSGAAGATARSQAQRKLAQVEQELTEVEEQLSCLERREDPEYQRWQRAAHARRYAEPQRERIIDVRFELS